MIIKELNLISFGKFFGKTISFEDGINILYGENESGKSTVMSFIQFMFYGSTTKKANISENIKLKFMPWDSEIIEGELTYSDNCNDYIIHRKAGKRSSIDIINKNTGESLDSDICKNIGMHLFGLSEDAFVKTYFISQSGSVTGPDKDGTLVKKLSNLESDADEDGSYTKVKERLEEEMLNLSSPRRSGALIPKLKEETDRLTKKLHETEICIKETESSKDEFNKTSDELKRLITEKESIKKEIELSERAKLSNNYNDALDKYNSAKTKYDETSEKYLKIDLSDYTAFENISDETVNKITADTGNDVSFLASSVVFAREKAKSSKTMGILSLVGAVVCAILGLFYPVAFAGMVVFALISVYGFINFSAQSKKANDIQNQISSLNSDKSALLSAYNCSSPTEFIQKHSEYLSLISDKKSLETSLEYLKTELENAKILLDKISQEIVSKYDKLENILNIFSDYDNIGNIEENKKRLEEISSSIVHLTAKEATLKQRLLASENIFEEYIGIKESIEHNNTLLKAYGKRLDILKRAYDILEKSFDEIKNNFAPKLNKNAGRILAEITGGKYQNLLINHDFETRIDSGKGYYQSPYFSGGTIDQLYFAVRFGIIETIKDDGRNHPVFLDDVFCQTDANRLSGATKFLAKYSQNTQVIYTTCHEREKVAFESVDNCNIVKL